MDPRKEAEELEHGSDVLYSDRNGHLSIVSISIVLPDLTSITRDPCTRGRVMDVNGIWRPERKK